MQRKITINERVIKVEKENAEAMIKGFRKNGKRYYVSIYAVHEESPPIVNGIKEKPNLLGLVKETRPEYEPSEIGKKLGYYDNYLLPNKYIVVLDRIFHIRNDIKIWEKLCENGIFDIWEPAAPDTVIKNRKEQMILIWRVYEIKEIADQVLTGFYDEVIKKNVEILRPIIPYNKSDHLSNDYKYDGELYFEDILDKVRSAVDPFLDWVEPYSGETGQLPIGESNVYKRSKKSEAKGYVYILSNPAFRDDLYKIGMTTRKPEDRKRELFEGSTGVPKPFVVEHERKVANCNVAEEIIHSELQKCRCNPYREFFAISLDKAKEITDKVCEKVESLYT